MKRFLFGLFLLLGALHLTAQPIDKELKTVTATGTNNYSVLLAYPNLYTYISGERFFVTFTNANTTAVTLNRNGLGVISVKKNGTTALSSGDITAGQTHLLAYDGTNYQCITCAGGSGGLWLTSGTTTITTPTIVGSPTFNGTLNVSGGSGPYVAPIFATGAASTGNVFVGVGANNVANIQTSTAATIDNVVMGLDAGSTLASNDNTLIGQQAGYKLTTSGRMTFVGSYAGRYMIGAGGSENVFVGYAAGGEVGHDTGGAFGVANNSVLLGGHAGFLNQGPYNNLINIGSKTGSFSSITGGSDELSIQNAIFGVANSHVDYTGVAAGRIGFYIMNPTAKVHISNVATAATNAFQVDNSTAGSILKITDAGKTLLGTSADVGFSASPGNGLNIGGVGGCSGCFTRFVDNTSTVIGQILINNSYINSKTSLGTSTSPTAWLMLGAGTVTAGQAPIKFQPGINQTIPEPGTVEYDGSIFYSTAVASARQVIRAEQFTSLTAAYTLTSQTALQKIFNSTTNGQLTVAASTSYFFEVEFDLSSMSASSGDFGFGFGGTATLTSVKYTSDAAKTAVGTPSTSQMVTATVATASSLVTANTTTTGHAYITGIVRVNAAGTLIPQVSLGVAAAAVVGANSWFRITPIGTNTVTNVGNWN